MEARRSVLLPLRPYGLRSSRTEHCPLNLQRPRGWARLNRQSGPNQVAKSKRLAIDKFVRPRDEVRVLF